MYFVQISLNDCASLKKVLSTYLRLEEGAKDVYFVQKHENYIHNTIWIMFYYMNNSVLPETKTLVFSIFSVAKL